mgnify:CR=1 FL=1
MVKVYQRLGTNIGGDPSRKLAAKIGARKDVLDGRQPRQVPDMIDGAPVKIPDCALFEGIENMTRKELATLVKRWYVEREKVQPNAQIGEPVAVYENGTADGHHHGQPPLFGHRRHQGHHLQLVLEVQVAGGLVHEQYRRLLGQGAGDDDLLKLAAAQLTHRPHGQGGQAQFGEQRFDLVVIVISRAPLQMGPAPQEDGLEDRQIALGMPLRHIPQAARHRFAGERRQIFVIHQHTAMSRDKQPVETLQEGGFAVVAPAHDERDYAFAKQFGLPIREVVAGGRIEEKAFTGEGPHVNSDFLNGLHTDDAIRKIIARLEEQGWGRRSVRYKLRDWLFSRQRYWGEPFPLLELEEGAEIGKILDLQPTAVRVTLSRARKTIREQLIKQHRYGIG